MGLSERKMAPGLGIRRPTGAEDGRRAPAAGLSWPLPTLLDAAALEPRLVPALPPRRAAPDPIPDGSMVHQDLTRQGVTWFLLGQEDTAVPPEGFQSRWVCQAYRAWAAKLALVMRPPQRAGDKLFVEYAGQSIPGVNRPSGAVHAAALCVAVMGAAHSPYAEATWPQRRPDWIGSPGRPLAALGGVPDLVVPATLKAAVPHAHRSDPELHRPYADLARPYGFAVLPARAAKPREKAQVAVGVPVVERWLLARLRPHTFCSLAEVTTALPPLLPALTARPCKKLPGSRQELCASLARPALRPLPPQPSA